MFGLLENHVITDSQNRKCDPEGRFERFCQANLILTITDSLFITYIVPSILFNYLPAV